MATLSPPRLCFNDMLTTFALNREQNRTYKCSIKMESSNSSGKRMSCTLILSFAVQAGLVPSTRKIVGLEDRKERFSAMFS